MNFPSSRASALVWRGSPAMLYVVGGGGCLIRNFADFDASRVIINEDICATAKGYEYMALVTLNRNGGVV